jgi:hypothetical protein
MEWSTPKTNWYGEMVDGVYTGDRFNAVDFNRIKNNLKYLRDLAIKMYAEFSIVDVGADKGTADYFYADEINQLEQNLITINTNTLNGSYGTPPTYSANGKTMNYTELNRLESAMLDLYDKLTNQHDGRRNLVWNFGMKGGL